MVVHPQPDSSEHIRVETNKPGVLAVVGGAGFTTEIQTLQDFGPLAGAFPDNIVKNIVNDVVHLGRHDLWREVLVGSQQPIHQQNVLIGLLVVSHAVLIAGSNRVSLKDNLVGKLDALDEIRLNAKTAIGKNGIARGQLKGGHGRIAER